MVNTDNDIRSIKQAKGLDPNHSHHKKEMITMWPDRDANYCYSANHITTY